MMGAPSPLELYQQLLDADEAGVKLEMVMGQPIWEFHPSPLHQGILRDVLRNIEATESNECDCFTLPDAYVAFRDGSLKRPDILIYRKMPPISHEALAVVPDAVVEIVSPGSEHKDLVIGPPFYLAQGVKDVVIYDPRTLMVLHHKRSGLTRHVSPVTLELECGCSVTV